MLSCVRITTPQLWLNPSCFRSTPISPLQPQTPEEQRLYDERHTIAQARRQERQREKEGLTEEGWATKYDIISLDTQGQCTCCA